MTQQTNAAAAEQLNLDDIDAIIEMANKSSEPSVIETLNAVIDSSANQQIALPMEAPVVVLDAVSIDVDAILAEINNAGSSTPEPTAAPTVIEKPARKRKASTSSPDVSTVSPPVVDAATEAGPTPAPVATPSPAPASTDPVAFAALLTEIDRAALSNRLEGAAQKVREKADNAMNAVNTGKKLSRFTSMAVTELVKVGEITSTDLVKVYTDAGLGMGTARAQSQQMTSLFRMFGLVSQDGRKFKLSNTALGNKLRELAA